MRIKHSGTNNKSLPSQRPWQIVNRYGAVVTQFETLEAAELWLDAHKRAKRMSRIEHFLTRAADFVSADLVGTR